MSGGLQVAVFFSTVGPKVVDSVEKLATWRKVVAAASDLARCGLVAVPSSVQMMGFVG